MLGRVSDTNWDLMQAAAKTTGRTFTDWATAELLAAASVRLFGDRAGTQGTEAVPEPDGPSPRRTSRRARGPGGDRPGSG